MPIPVKIRVYETLIAAYNRSYAGLKTIQIMRTLPEYSPQQIRRALYTLQRHNIIKGHRSRHTTWQPTSATTATTYLTLTRFYRASHAAVSAQAIGKYCGKNDRIIRDKLADLESAGIVQRVGERSGWLPTRRKPPTAAERLQEIIANFNQYPTSRRIATELGISQRWARALLNRYRHQYAIH